MRLELPRISKQELNSKDLSFVLSTREQMRSKTQHMKDSNRHLSKPMYSLLHH